jgi:phosphoribosylformylglycinamidine synthase
MSKACEKFATPVTGGNVSFYNQTAIGDREEAVFPTPAIGMVGIVEKKKHITSLAFEKEGDLIFMLGKSRNDISSSEYLYSYCNVKRSPAPYFDLEEEFHLQQTLTKAIEGGKINSAHDCSDGGLFITLMESCMPTKLGFEIAGVEGIRKDAFLFGESQSRVVVSINAEIKDEFVAWLAEENQHAEFLGRVASKDYKMDGQSLGKVEDFTSLYLTSIEQKLS